MGIEEEKKRLLEVGGVDEASGWQRVAAHLEAAIAAIPRAPYQTVSNPKELASRVKLLCKQLKGRLKEAMEKSKFLCHRIVCLLQDLLLRISEIWDAFRRFLSDKVSRFTNWLSSLIHTLRRRLSSKPATD